MRSFDEQLHLFIAAALAEDIGEGDHTTLSCIPPDALGVAQLKIKQAGMLAGISVAQKIFQFLEPTAHFTAILKDGDPIKVGDIAFSIQAKMHTLLQGERLVLNTLQRMSGIATLTHAFAEQIKGYPARLLDTRKTTPNFRLLEKEAVRIGGGHNHRFGLFDRILLKDNHIDFCGSMETAINRAYDYVQNVVPGLAIEVEARSLEEVTCALHTGKVDRILLDNFMPEGLKEAVALIAGRIETEASGGIHLGNIRAYAQTGVNFISVGALIHQAQSLDMSLKAVIA
jgi:nicotinate-nucleotide pyrophosphorylase (carboxylating)